MRHQIDHYSSTKDREREWVMPSGSRPYRRALIIGAEAAIYFDRQCPTTWSEHTHSYAQILISFDPAACTITYRNVIEETPQTRRIEGRHICMISPGLLHALQWECEADMLVIYAHTNLLRNALVPDWTGVVCGEFAKAVTEDSAIWLMTSLCRRLGSDNDPANRHLIEQLGHALAVRLLKAQFGPVGQNRPQCGLTEEQFRQVTDYIDSHLNGAVSNNELARLAGVSELHFIRLFRNTVGMPPGRYQNVCRMRKAEAMLATGKYRINEIADALGYSDMSYFDRCFRKFFEASPSAYRQRFRTNLSKSLQG